MTKKAETVRKQYSQEISSLLSDLEKPMSDENRKAIERKLDILVAKTEVTVASQKQVAGKV